MARLPILIAALAALAPLASAQTPGASPPQDAAQPAGGGVYRPITSGQRLQWYLRATAGPASLAGGAISAGFSTGVDKPEEYGGTWKGFGKRYAMRLSGVSIGNGIEAGLGAAWGEDPRYPRAESKPFGQRVGNILKYTVVARDSRGRDMPAYARFAGNVGNNFLTNLWRVESENGTGNALARIGLGVGARAASNAFAEFWPDVRRKLFGK